jgi:hypothetical protein
MRGFVFIQAEGLTTKKDQLYWLRLALAYNPLAKKSGR